MTSGLARVSIVAAALGAAATISVSPAGASAGTTSVVAQAVHHVVQLYRSPAAVKPYRTMRSPTPVGEPLVFLVKRRIAGWEQVYLPARPNGSTAWVRDGEVDLSLDPYRLVVSLRRHELVVYDGRRVLRREAAGVGRSVLPTPTGTYYLVDLLKQPDPFGLYGPYAFGTSAFSNVLYSYGGGPGEIGIHGTDEPWGLGANVSHGCIRISNAAISYLAHILPLGTPVQIRA